MGLTLLHMGVPVLECVLHCVQLSMEDCNKLLEADLLSRSSLSTEGSTQSGGVQANPFPAVSMHCDVLQLLDALVDFMHDNISHLAYATSSQHQPSTSSSNSQPRPPTLPPAFSRLCMVVVQSSGLNSYTIPPLDMPEGPLLAPSDLIYAELTARNISQTSYLANLSPSSNPNATADPPHCALAMRCGQLLQHVRKSSPTEQIALQQATCYLAISPLLSLPPVFDMHSASQWLAGQRLVASGPELGGVDESSDDDGWQLGRALPAEEQEAEGEGGEEDTLDG